MDSVGKIKGRDNDTETLYYDWSYRGDGEALNTITNENDFLFLEEKQERHENRLKNYEEEDYEFVTISELVYTTLEKGLGTHKLDQIPCNLQAIAFGK